jgi:hypothetical protein
MIHKRYNHTRHLIWAAFVLTLFVSSAATHRQKDPSIVQQQMSIEKTTTISIVAVK